MNNLQRESQHITLSAEEKSRVRASLVQFAHEHPAVRMTGNNRYIPRRTQPIFTFLSAFISPITHKPMSIMLAIALLVSGSVSYAAENTVPGDTLYPIKVEVNEPVREIFALSAESKAEWQARVVERRLEEAEELAAENRVDTETRARIEENFENHAQRVQSQIADLEGSAQAAAAADISAQFETSLRTHAAILDRLDEKESAHEMDIRPLVARVRAQADKTAKTRVRLETSITGRANADVKTAAEGRRTAAENKIREVRSFIGKSSVSAEAKADAEARLKLADDTMAQGNVKLEAGLYKDAFELFQKAHRIAEEAKLLVVAESSLQHKTDIHILGNIIRVQTNTSTDSGTSTDSKETDEENKHDIDSNTDTKINTQTEIHSGNTGVKTNSNVQVDLGL